MDQFQADAEAAAAERAAAGVANFEPDPYDGHLNHQELSKTLLDLSALYREAHRVGVRVVECVLVTNVVVHGAAECHLASSTYVLLSLFGLLCRYLCSMCEVVTL